MAKRKTARKKAQFRIKGLRMSGDRTIRISNFKVVFEDRHVEVARKAKIKWQNLSATDCEVVFGSSTDPFVPGKVIDVPGGGESEQEVIRGLPGTYKYSVQKPSGGDVTDDPNIIIKS